MRRSLIITAAIATIFALVGCSGTSVDKKPTYKFYATADGASWATDMVLPSSTPTEACYIDNIYYSTYYSYIYLTVRNPKNNHRMELEITIPELSQAVGTYTCSSGKFSPTYYRYNQDVPKSQELDGQFQVTQFSYDLNAGRVLSFSGKFNFTQTAKHSDGSTKTTIVAAGEVNNLSQ